MDYSPVWTIILMQSIQFIKNMKGMQSIQFIKNMKEMQSIQFIKNMKGILLYGKGRKGRKKGKT
jgi:hypothetical protein